MNHFSLVKLSNSSVKIQHWMMISSRIKLKGGSLLARHFIAMPYYCLLLALLGLKTRFWSQGQPNWWLQVALTCNESTEALLSQVFVFKDFGFKWKYPQFLVTVKWIKISSTPYAVWLVWSKAQIHYSDVVGIPVNVTCLVLCIFNPRIFIQLESCSRQGHQFSAIWVKFFLNVKLQ